MSAGKFVLFLTLVFCAGWVAAQNAPAGSAPPQCAAPGWFQRAELVARHSDAATGNCHSASQHSYAARRHGSATDKSSPGIGRADGSPAKRDSGHYAAIHDIPQ